MRVKLARTAGFCMGVRRAMNIVLDAANSKKGEIHTLGPLVHNPQAISMLEQKGVSAVGNGPVTDSTVIIRAHGVTPDERRKIKEAGNKICDATCPHVSRAQSLVRRAIREGYSAIIIGDKGHAEVNGLLGYADGNGYVIENIDDLENLPNLDKACIIAQTTQDRKSFKEITDSLEKKIPELKTFDTICDATNMRQKEVLELAEEVDAMVIVGGKNSANTRRLYEISLSSGTPSFHIEEEDELPGLGLEQYENVGVMAGASTPNWVINSVIDRINHLLKKRGNMLFRFLESIGTFMVESTLYLSLGAVSLCYASLIFQGIVPTYTILSIAFLYIFSVHVFNRYNDRTKDQFSDPARTRFFEDYGKPIILTASAAALASLYFSYLLGTVPFLFLLFSYLMGVIYSLKIVPDRLLPFIKYKRIKDFPGSKEFLVSLAWAWVIVMIPFLEQSDYSPYSTIAILLFVTTTVFIRSLVFDIVSIEGDRIVGRETIPIFIGRQRTKKILILLSVLIGVLMYLAAYLELVPALGYFLILLPAFMVACLYLFEKRQIKAGILFEAVIDSNFLLAGLMTYIWKTAL